jgi:membrane-associated phospholipid phosphatase
MRTGTPARTYASPMLDPSAANAPPAEPLGAPQRRRAGIRFDLLALAGFGAVFTAVRLNRTAAFDLSVTLRIQARRSPGIANLMEVVSWPGFPPESRIIPPGIAVLLWWRRHRLEALFQAAAWGTALLSTVVKEVTGRQRPLPPDVQVVVANLGGSSFPSGHVLTYVGVYGFAAHLANSLIRPRWLRAIVVAPLVGLLGLIGPSRIYLGHHWPTDVLASYLLGIASLLGLTTLYERLKRREAGS